MRFLLILIALSAATTVPAASAAADCGEGIWFHVCRSDTNGDGVPDDFWASVGTPAGAVNLAAGAARGTDGAIDARVTAAALAHRSHVVADARCADVEATPECSGLARTNAGVLDAPGVLVATGRDARSGEEARKADVTAFGLVGHTVNVFLRCMDADCGSKRADVQVASGPLHRYQGVVAGQSDAGIRLCAYGTLAGQTVCADVPLA